MGDTREVRLAVPAAWDGIAERQSTTAGAGTKPSPAHTYALSCPADPSLALQGSGTAEDTAEQQLLGLPLPEHPSALPSAALFSHLSPAKLQKTAQLKRGTGDTSPQWNRKQEDISYKVKNILKAVF